MAEPVGASVDLERYLADEREATDAAITRILADASTASSSLGPAIRHALAGGAKRLRPVFCVAAYRAVPAATDPVPAAVYRVAAVVELVHTYSLVHDDLPCMDDDELRRGRPATHRAYGVARATLAGAALIPLACQALDRAGRDLGLQAEERRRLVVELCTAAGAAGMVGGQWLDLEAEGRRITLDELESIHRHKTGALLSAAMRLGGLAAHADPTVLAALSDYGRAVGLAFQIADDVLDRTASSAVLGKTAGKDARADKATFPALLGLDAARRRAVGEADFAVDVLRRAGLRSPELESLAVYAVERKR